RLLLGHHPQGHRHSNQHVHRHLRPGADCRLDFPLEGNDRQRPEDRPPTPAVYRPSEARPATLKKSVTATTAMKEGCPGAAFFACNTGKASIKSLAPSP